MTNCSHALLLFLLAAPALAQSFIAKVVSIADGDTISVLRDGSKQRVRLNAIDSPERNQPFGTRARQFAGELTHGKVVTVHQVDTDRYGRIIADVILPDGRNLNHELVKAGLAWWYRRYAPRDSFLQALELGAREGWQRIVGGSASGRSLGVEEGREGKSEFHNDPRSLQSLGLEQSTLPILADHRNC